MANFIVRRIVYMILLLLVLSFVSFIIIQLPPGDYLSTMIQNMHNLGEMIRALESRYGLDQPLMLQYLKWLGNLLQGDMGRSFEWNEEVTKLIAQRLALTVTISFASLIFVYVVAVPVGIYSATHQYSLGDYSFTLLGFIGLATPNFLLALILMYVAFSTLGWSVGGLFSREYILEPWSFGKVIDLLKHLPIPLIVIGTAGTAAIIRILRSSLLDELAKQYVITARAKGLHEGIILFKYPVRLALNPIISSIGGLLPTIVSGATLTSIVLSLPTIGPLLLRALQAQDMYLAGSMVMLLSALAMIGTLSPTCCWSPSIPASASNRRHGHHLYAPPSSVRIIHEGRLQRPFVYGLRVGRNPETLAPIYESDTQQIYPLRFLVRGHEYRLIGLLPTDLHFVGVDEPGYLFLFGTDSLGRDMFSRVLAGARISLSVGLFGVVISFVLGCLLGGVSGYFGGAVDMLVQRVIEFLQALPSIPL